MTSDDRGWPLISPLIRRTLHDWVSSWCPRTPPLCQLRQRLCPHRYRQRPCRHVRPRAAAAVVVANSSRRSRRSRGSGSGSRQPCTRRRHNRPHSQALWWARLKRGGIRPGTIREIKGDQGRSREVKGTIMHGRRQHKTKSGNKTKSVRQGCLIWSWDGNFHPLRPHPLRH